MGVAAVNHTVTLSWSPAVSGVTGFNTYSSSTSGGPYTKLTFSPLTSPSYTDSSVQSGRTYFYVVTAVDASNQESGYSTEVAAVMP
jgi:fibronectin type 3 domain-containing protein